MKPLPPVSSFHVHAGNGYRGPGAWKRPRQKHFAFPEGPLDLGRILGNLDRQHRNLHQQHGTKNRGKQGKAAALQKRLESLSLALAPSPGVGKSPALPYPRHHVAGGDVPHVPPRGQSPQHDKGGPLSPVGVQPSKQRQQQYDNQQRPIYCANELLQGPSEGGSRCDVALVDNGNSSQQQKPCTNIVAPDEAVLNCGQRGSDNVAQQADRSSLLLSGTSKGNGPASTPRARRAALRIPNPVTKMSIDDSCTSDILGARAVLRALLNEQKKLGDIIRRRRMEACLGDGGIANGSAVRRRRREPAGDSGVRRAARKRSLRKRGGREKDVRGGVKRGSHARPLVFMEEEDVRKAELDQMRLEDAEATHLLKLEKARRRKQDYAMYYRLAVKYGPLSEDQFELDAYPGSQYHGKIVDASRVIQNWWWSLWPRVLRRRKAAALMIQSAFRGFSQRRRWHAIIRLRTAWGNTRVVAHSFVVWRDTVARIRRVGAFTSRFRNRSKINCLKVLRCNVAEQKRMREELLRDRLRRVSEGVRLRVFEAWVRYTETSLAIKRLRFRSSAQPAFRGWWKITSEDRMRSRLVWACATLASRLLRWKTRSQYTKLRGSCVKIQTIVRMQNATSRIKNNVRASRIRRAEEAVQALEDIRVHRLIDVEQQRLTNLQAVIDQDTPSTYQNALAFLEASVGKAAVAGRLAAVPSISESEADAKQEVVRLFMRREQAWLRHDFNANYPPPPLRCPRGDSCDATFVKREHCLRHAVDVHPEDAPEVAELSAAMRDSAGLTIFDEFIDALTESGGDSRGAVPQTHLVIDADDSVAAARSTLGVWKAIEEWRAVSTTSSGNRCRQLGASILNKFGSGGTNVSNAQRSAQSYLPDDIGAALSGDKLLQVFGKLGQNYHASNKSKKHHHHSAPVRSSSSSSRSDGVGVDVDPFALEEASFRAVFFLAESAVGQAFLRSEAYRKYLDRLQKPMRDAVEKAATDIAVAEAARWAAEARRLRAAALDREQEVLVDSLAGQASNLVLHGTASAGFLGCLIDDQASLLAVMILAERRTFTKVISAVWNEAVDEAARLAAVEAREVDPCVSAALSEAAYSFTRSRIMDELIDQCATDLTGPQGDLWPDARVTAAVTDGVGYRVRDELMSELIDEAVGELTGSGEAEKLMSDAAASRRTREESGGGEEADEATGGGGTTLPAADGESNLEYDHRAVMPSPGTLRGTTAEGAAVTAPPPRSSCSALALVGVGDELLDGIEDERTNVDRGWRDNGRGGVMTETEAAVLVQAVLRRKAVYRETKTRVARNFVRLYDPGEGAYYWYNHTTMESSWEKPAIIDAYFKKPSFGKSLLRLGETLSSGKPTRSSFVNGFESSTPRYLQ